MSFVIFTKSQFERGLYKMKSKNTDIIFVKSLLEKNINEYIYILDIKNKDMKIKIWSTVDTKTERSREKGEDTIKVALVYSKDMTKILYQTHNTKRTDNWESNLTNKINEVLDIAKNIKRCEKCSSPMIKKKGKYGYFYGCINFPKCNYTVKA